jgi:hypothetical protein
MRIGHLTRCVLDCSVVELNTRATPMTNRAPQAHSLLVPSTLWRTVLSVAASFSAVEHLRAADLILNEWNAVGSAKWLGNPSTATPGCPQPDGPSGESCSTNDDVFFGRRLGNGGDWIELVVVKDHADIRGWRVQWIEASATDADGTDIWYGNGNTPQGQITFSNAAVWGDLRAGTIITITEASTALGGLDTDLSFNPCAGDWWLNVNCFDAALVTCDANVYDASNPTYDDPMDVGNDNWAARILNAAGQEVMGMVGEGQPSWGASGVNSREACRLEADPSQSITPYSPYDDADNSSFGQPNSWSDLVTQCKTYQNFSALRAPVAAELCTTCRPFALNEYNAVSASGFLGGGTQAADSAGGQASDTFFGRRLGNGGNWMEFVVVADHLDLRGSTLRWRDKSASGVVTLSSAPFWGDLPSGMIITIVESTTAEGGLNTDLSYNPASGDRWVNINSFDTALISGTTSTKPDHLTGQFSTSNDRWAVALYNASGQQVIELQGEGSHNFLGGSVGATDVCRLREAVTGRNNAASYYDDSSVSSTFGAPNTWVACPGTATIVQSFVGLPEAGCSFSPPNPADVDGDGQVSGSDLAAVLSAWGTNHPAADINGSGIVDATDLAILLAYWLS